MTLGPNFTRMVELERAKTAQVDARDLEGRERISPASRSARYRAVLVGPEATRLDGGAPLTGRTTISILLPGVSGPIFIGFDAGVTPTNGWIVEPEIPLFLNLGPAVTVWAVSIGLQTPDSATRILEF